MKWLETGAPQCVSCSAQCVSALQKCTIPTFFVVTGLHFAWKCLRLQTISTYTLCRVICRLMDDELDWTASSRVLLSLNTLSPVWGRADNSCKGTEEKQDSFADSLWQTGLHATTPPAPHTTHSHTHTHNVQLSAVTAWGSPRSIEVEPVAELPQRWWLQWRAGWTSVSPEWSGSLFGLLNCRWKNTQDLSNVSHGCYLKDNYVFQSFIKSNKTLEAVL